MISVAEATQKILAQAFFFDTEKVALAAAEGRILAQSLRADRDFPPFDRVSMDGIAILFDDFLAGKKAFHIAATQAAGQPALDFSPLLASPPTTSFSPLLASPPTTSSADFSIEKGDEKTAEKGNEKGQPEPFCCEIMTGAPLPPGLDTVVRFEDLDIRDGLAFLKISTIQRGQNVHRKGADRKSGDVLVEPFRRLTGAEIAVAATVGQAEILVKKKPRAAVISTGDELVGIAQTPLDHQIRTSNSPSIAAVLRENGCETDLFHLPDDPTAIRAFFENEAQKGFDFIVATGGVSAGRFDFLPQILQETGCQKILHSVRQRPGKPLFVGRFSGGGPMVFGLPGNPVSTFMCLFRFVLPWLRAGLGLEPFDEKRAALAEPFVFRPPLDHFLQVKTSFSADGRLLARPVAGGGSGDLANLLEADAFLELPAAERDVFEAGEAFAIHFFR